MGTTCFSDTLKKTAILLSDSIRPYYEAAQGIEKRLNDEKMDIKIFELNDYNGAEFDSVSMDIVAEGYKNWIGIGPGAVKTIWNSKFPDVSLKVYSMVLKPEELIPRGSVLCGVSLYIPVEEQVKTILSSISDNVKPGIIYDPENNSEFANRAYTLFAENKVELSLIKVSSTSDVAQVLMTGLKMVDLLWMIPDKTIISESLIPYIIKSCLKQGVAVVGYNQYFLVKGAAASFVIDYKEAGALTAEKLIMAMDKKVFNSSGPGFEFKINPGVIQMLKNDYEKNVFH